MTNKDTVKSESYETESQVYIPSSSEKKRVVMMYLLFGIIVYLSKVDISSYEYSHLKQATGLWIVLVPMLVFSFIPLLKYISILIIVLLLVVWGISINQARNGKTPSSKNNSPLLFFSGVGNRFLELFEISNKVNTPKQSPIDESSEIEQDMMKSDDKGDLEK